MKALKQTAFLRSYFFRSAAVTCWCWYYSSVLCRWMCYMKASLLPPCEWLRD